MLVGHIWSGWVTLGHTVVPGYKLSPGHCCASHIMPGHLILGHCGSYFLAGSQCITPGHSVSHQVISGCIMLGHIVSYFFFGGGSHLPGQNATPGYVGLHNIGSLFTFASHQSMLHNAGSLILGQIISHSLGQGR